MKRCFLLLVFSVCLSSLWGQIVIWEDSFDAQVGKGVWGDDVGGVQTDFSGVSWTLDYSNCTFSEQEDYVKVAPIYSKGRFEARDCDGEAIWESENITISGYSNINITAKLKQTGSSNNQTKKYIRIYSIVDGVKQAFTTNYEGKGKFDDLDASTTISSGTNLKIRVELKTVNKNDKIIFDDLKIIGTPSAPSGNDTDSEITAPDTQISDQTLVVVAANQAEKEVFKFKIRDKGTADAKPTKPTQIILKKAAQNTLDWASKILSAKLVVGTDIFSGVITDDALTFTILSGDLEVADATSKEFTLKIKTAISIAEGTKFQVRVDAEHGFEADASGSTFTNTLAAPITSNIVTFDVQATALQFSTHPAVSIVKNTDFSVQVQAVDAHGNVDTDYATVVTLSATNISGTTSVDPTNGVADFSAVQITATAQNIKLTATSGALSVQSSAFDVTDVIDMTSTAEQATLPATTTIAPNEVAEVFAFTFADKGGDNYPTKVKQITIKPAASNELAYTTAIQKASLQVGGTTVTTTATITDAGIVLDFPENAVTVAENTVETCVFSVQLATSTISEGKILAFEIPQSNHELLTWNTQSSKFATNLPAAITSNQITTEITASKIVITGQPTVGVVGQQIMPPITAQLTDAYENIDKNTVLSASLSVASGTGTLSGTLTQTTTNGVCTWNDIVYDNAEQITLKIATTGFSTLTQPIDFSASNSSIIGESTAPINTGVISSTQNSPNKTQDIFKFEIKDNGDDGLPTKVKAIRFVKGAEFSQSRLYYLIGGIILKQGNTVIGQINKLSSSNGSSYVKIPLSLPLVIADGSSVEITASIFVSSHTKLKEGEKIQIEIAKNHGWELATGTTGIAPLANEITSAVFTVDVAATKLQFDDLPNSITPNTSFSATVKAVDTNGIVDENYSGTVTLSREAGTGVLSSATGLSLQFTNGKATWTDLQYDTGESFTLLATSTDFSAIESNSINAADMDSKLLVPSTPIAANSLASTIAEENTAQPVFAFDVKDNGTNDRTPTILTQLVFKNMQPVNAINWKNNIAGAVLLQNDNVVATTNRITNETITFYNSGGVTSIPDGTTANLKLAIYLKYNNIEDNKIFQCRIDAADTDFKTSGAGSSKLQPLSADIVSQPITIEVIATRVDFLQVPYALDAANQQFSLTIAARDTNGNIDTDTNGDLTIEDSQNIAATTFTNGIANLSGLQQTGTKDFVLKASSGGLKAAEQKVRISKITVELDDNFESGNIAGWQSSSAWKASIVAPISGTYSLKHNLTNASGNSYVKHPIGNFSLQEGVSVWRVQLKNGDWNASSSNNFCFVLASAATDFNSGTIYTVGINQSGANDVLTLSKIENGKATTLISSKMIWKEEDLAGIQVKLDGNGQWQLAYDNNGGFDNLYTTGSIVDIPNLQGNLFSGFIFNHETASRAGQFWADDVKVYHFSTEPKVDSLKVVSANRIEVVFSQEMEQTSVEQKINYSLDNATAINNAQFVAPNKAILTTQNLKTASYKLTLKDILSKKGITLADTTVVFTYFEEATKGAVVINELFVDETPSVQLPEHEYIELVNTTDKPFLLTDWTLKVGKYERKLPTDTIQPKQYVLLCKSSAKEALAQYGKVIVVSSFPALTNTSGTIVLKNAKAVVIDEVSYEKSWYKDEEKEEGGWSLEKIHPTAENTIAGWQASYDQRGGTPAAKNSVVNKIIKAVVVESATQIKVELNTVLDKSFAETITNYSLSDAKGNTVQITKAEFTTGSTSVTLTVSKLKMGNYTLRLQNMKDTYGDSLAADTIQFTYFEEATKGNVVINELFVDETPAVQLPEYEYIELVNTTDKPFLLTDWTLKVGKYERKLPTDTIQPNQYVLLCKSSAKEALAKYGKVIVVSSFPALTNTSGTVTLKNAKGVVIDEVSYEKSWYKDEEKEEGGWSLEKIYPTAENTIAGWQASYDQRGGTPAAKNSVVNKIIKAVVVESATQIKVELNTILDKSFAETITNYSLSDAKGSNVQITKAEFTTGSSSVTLTVSKLKMGNYTLRLQNMKDTYGNSLAADTIQFTYFEEATKGDVVINELFVDETPAVQLPEYEYIELVNTTDKLFLLTDWTIKVGKYERSLPTDTIQPKQYVLLCKSSAKEALAQYGKVIVVSSFPALTNTSGTVVLKNAKGIVIDEVSYEKSWYKDEEKEEGGWSLEKIHLTAENNINGWQASYDQRGGTPAAKNSVVNKIIKAVVVESATQIKVELNTVLDKSFAETITNYSLSDAKGNTVQITKAEFTTGSTSVTLTVSKLKMGNYTLRLQNMKDTYGDSLAADTIQFTYFEEATKGNVVINELFVDETPAVQLPEYEYIELVNTTDKPFLLTDWTIKVSKYERNLPIDTIQPNQYVLLCKSSAKEALSQYGKVIVVSSFPALTNTSGTIVLKNAKAVVIDEVSYEKSWYKDEEKEEGGWSLEKIHPTAENTIAGWQASYDERGGTPAAKNSVVNKIIKAVVVESATQIKVELNTVLDKSFAETIANYSLSDTKGNTIQITKAEFTTGSSSVTLTVSKLKMGNYTLRLQNMKDTYRNSLADDTIRFTYFEEATKGAVVINELFVDETPSVKLPEYEYIELVNTTDKPFLLTDWTLKVGKYERKLPTDTIQPNQYVLLCKSSAKEALAKYGKVIVVSSFPALTNTSGTVTLKNAKGVVIDEVSYEKSWYKDEEKEEGGWSLERIEAAAPSNSELNWGASQDERGGTPAEENSIKGVVVDNVPPAIENVTPVSNNKLLIKFSEMIDTLAVGNKQLFFVNGVGKPETIVASGDSKQITLIFKDDFEYGKIYEVEIKEVVDLYGNVLERATATFGLSELASEKELIINEILFNPVSGNVDYVELYNRSSKILDLSTLFIATRDAKGLLKSVYVMSETSRLLKPNEFVVLTKDVALVVEQYDVKNPSALLEMKALPSFPDDKGTVVILNQESTVVDEFSYSEKMHLALLTSKEGISLERISYELPTQDTNNWHSASEVSGFGTPTYKNSVYSEFGNFDTNITIAPKVFSPNGDGVDDIMQIHYDFDAPGNIANVTIFDSTGRLVRDIARNLTLDAKGVINWDGVNAENQRARTGRYLIFMEVFDTEGNVSVYKRSCVLFGRFK